MLFMTQNILKNFVRPKATRAYPFVVREPFENFRGELVNDMDKCIFCSMCAKKCPSQCITVDRTTGTWDCDPYACVYCSVCVDSCPVNSLSMKNQHRKPAVVKEPLLLKGTPPQPKKKTGARAKASGSETPPTDRTAPGGDDTPKAE